MLAAATQQCCSFLAWSVAGFLSGYRGLTRDAYTLDLGQYTAWCALHGLHLFDARRVDIEFFPGADPTGP